MHPWPLVLRPTVIVPRTIVESAGPSLRYCLAHERSHIDRGDLTSWMVTRACQYLFWYQPAYWLLVDELRLCQEFLADQALREPVTIRWRMRNCC